MKKPHVKPVAFLVDEVSRKHKLLFRMTPKNGPCFYFAVDAADASKYHLLTDTLRNYGLPLPREKDKADAWLKENISKVLGKLPERLLVHRTGWTEDLQFVMNNKTFGKSDRRAFHVNRLTADVNTVNPKDAALEDWLASLAELTKHSCITIFCTALSFSGPVLRWLLSGPDLPLFNLMGESTSGKTTVMMLATTVFGGVAKEEDLVNFDHTGRHLEETLGGSNELFQAIDEEGTAASTAYSKDSALKLFAMIVAGGRGRGRSVAVKSTLPQMTWKCGVLTTSNVVVSGVNGIRTTKSPASVRWIELPIRKSSSGGVFDHPGSSLSKKQRMQHLSTALKGCMSNRGAAGEAWLKILMEKKQRERIVADCIGARNRFFDLHQLALTETQMRILNKFSVIFALASVLPDLKLVPWSKEEGEEAVTYVYECFVLHHNEEYIDKISLLVSLQKLIDDPRRFPPLEKARRAWRENPESIFGFRNKFRDRDVVCLLPERTDVLAKLLSMQYSALEAILSGQGLYVLDASNKSGFMSRFPSKDKRCRYDAIDIASLGKAIA
jgi:hypothetical protein